jgi:hypothetical protein
MVAALLHFLPHQGVIDLGSVFVSPRPEPCYESLNHFPLWV